MRPPSKGKILSEMRATDRPPRLPSFSPSLLFVRVCEVTPSGAERTTSLWRSSWSSLPSSPTSLSSAHRQSPYDPHPENGRGADRNERRDKAKDQRPDGRPSQVNTQPILPFQHPSSATATDCIVKHGKNRILMLVRPSGRIISSHLGST